MGSNTIERKQNYSIIYLSGELVTAEDGLELKHAIDEISTESEVNVIISLKDVENISLENCALLEDLHQQFYNNGLSIVFAEPHESVLMRLKQEQLHLVINITPTIIEACDIINMEILERDLMNED